MSGVAVVAADENDGIVRQREAVGERESSLFYKTQKIPKVNRVIDK